MLDRYLVISRRSTKLLAATTLRNVLGTKELAMLLSDREAITQQVWQLLDDATGPWGVYVERVEMLASYLVLFLNL